MHTTNFELTISASGYWWVIIILLILLILIVRSNPFLIGVNKTKPAGEKKWAIIIAFSVIVLFFLDEITWLSAKAIVTVDTKKMTVTKYFWGIPFADNYNLSEISNFRTDHNVPGYWRFRIGRGARGGLPLALDPTILYFDYDGKTESIGKHLNNFHSEYIINAVKNEQK